jgi:hypothetical protein
MTTRYLIIVMAYLLLHSVMAVGADKQWGELSLREAEETINSTPSEAKLRELALRALDSKRMELISLCFKNEHTAYHLRDGVAAMPDSINRDRLVLMMLKSDSPFWGSDAFRQVGPVVLGSIKEPFVSVIKKYLPQLEIDERLFETRGARESLAIDVEKAGREKWGKAFVEPLTVLDSPDEGELRNAAPSLIESSRSKAKDDGTRTDRPGAKMRWMIGLAAVAGVFIFCMRCLTGRTKESRGP